MTTGRAHRIGDIVGRCDRCGATTRYAGCEMDQCWGCGGYRTHRHDAPTSTIATIQRGAHTVTVEAATTSDRVYVRLDGRTIRTIGGRGVADPIRTALLAAAAVRPSDYKEATR